MGQQHNKIIKRRRRKNYVARKKALAKSGALRKSSRRSDAPKSAAKKAVKKPAVKKVKAPKKVEELAEAVAEIAVIETDAVVDAAPAEETAAETVESAES